jgi:hypothetical protein
MLVGLAQVTRHKTVQADDDDDDDDMMVFQVITALVMSSKRPVFMT